MNLYGCDIKSTHLNVKDLKKNHQEDLKFLNDSLTFKGPYKDYFIKETEGKSEYTCRPS